MKKLKWWHWVLIVFAGMFVLGSLVDDPENNTAQTGSKYEDADAQFRELAGEDMFVMTFNAKADPKTLPTIVRDHCGTRDFCKVFGWTNPEFAPRGFPMTDREEGAQVLSYGINRTTGYEELTWDCEKFGKMEGVICDGEAATEPTG